MDLAARLQQLEEMVREAKSMPLSSSALLNREELLELVKEMQETLPEEIKQARWIVKDREELLAKARHDAEAIVEKARREQLEMASQLEVVNRAEAEAERVLTEAAEEARKLRLEAEDYADSKLAAFQMALRRIDEELRATTGALARTNEQVDLGRQRLRGTAQQVAEELGPPPEPEPPFDAEGAG